MLVFVGGDWRATVSLKVKRYSYENGGFLLLGDSQGQILLKGDEIKEVRRNIELYQERNLSVIHHAGEAQRVISELIEEARGAESVAVVTVAGGKIELIRPEKGTDVFGRLRYQIRQGSRPVGLVGYLNLKGEMRFYTRPLAEFAQDEKVAGLLQDGLRQFARDVLTSL